MSTLRQSVKRSVAVSRLLGVRSASKFWVRSVWRGGTQEVELIRPRGLPGGLWIRPRGTDLDVAMQIFLARDYDLSWDEPYQEHIRAISDRIRGQGNIPVIIDAGANIGASSLWFSLHFPESQIIAIEPDKDNFAMLTRNVAERANVRVIRAGIWDCSTALALKSEDDASWGRRVKEADAAGSGIASVTIPEIFASNPKFRPLIVKIDIEGAETALFRSNTEWVDGVPLLIFEPHDNLWRWLGTWIGTAHSFFSVLARRKREYLFRGENVFAFLHPDDVAS